ncbi:hypothetical protein GCM10007935_11080 [Hydrogenophaga electricum]|uniref:Uncharacterized protein n=1 Tax=Hydrogenophaga electricum TaxID=1230953 RepID=A0ABQ6BZX3_9BURK|nr:hypothetical protein GCM10007935_11080 [Hydrogenophaga electricum]
MANGSSISIDPWIHSVPRCRNRTSPSSDTVTGGSASGVREGDRTREEGDTVFDMKDPERQQNTTDQRNFTRKRPGTEELGATDSGRARYSPASLNSHKGSL